MTNTSFLAGERDTEMLGGPWGVIQPVNPPTNIISTQDVGEQNRKISATGITTKSQIGIKELVVGAIIVYIISKVF